MAIERAALRPHTCWNPLQLSFGVSATWDLLWVRRESASRNKFRHELLSLGRSRRGIRYFAWASLGGASIHRSSGPGPFTRGL